MSDKTYIRIAYIGGGSRMWARALMADIALDKTLSGEVRLYDINHKAAQDNAIIGELYQKHMDAKSTFTYQAYETLEETLKGVDFVVISILPATFDQMSIYAHYPEKYGIYQSVGDTTGPAGIMRGLIAFPMFVDFAKAIKKYSPNAWVINFTNPMTLCLQALYHGYPEIKAYGNCHEVFGSQKDLCDLYQEIFPDEKVDREDVKITVNGINHFTWITQASCKGFDLMPAYQKKAQEIMKHQNDKKETFMNGYPFESESFVKYDLINRFHVMAAAGDRHLAEFMPHHDYLLDKETVKKYRFSLTPVAWRIEHFNEAVNLTERLIQKEESVKLVPSGEEGIRQIKALMGYEELITNVNFINKGQAEGLPLGHIVETNALFRYKSLEPIVSKRLPSPVESMVLTHINNQKLVEKAYVQKDLTYALKALYSDPLSKHLPKSKLKSMFYEMVDQLHPYLDYYINKKA